MTVRGRKATVAVAASEFGVSEQTIRHWIRTGRISAELVGNRRYMVDLDSVAVDVSAAPDDPRREALVLALRCITPEDSAAMEDLAARLAAAVDGSPLPFWMIWDVLGAVSHQRARRAPALTREEAAHV